MSPLLSRFRPEWRCWDASAPSLLTGGEGLFRDHRNFQVQFRAQNAGACHQATDLPPQMISMSHHCLLHQRQFGHVHWGSCEAPIEVVNGDMYEHACENGEELHDAYLDVTSAFGTVQHPALTAAFQWWHCANEPGTYHVLGEPCHLPVLRTHPLYHNEERGNVLVQTRWVRSSVCLAAILARKPRIEMQPAAGRHRLTNVGFLHANIFRTDVRVSHHAFLQEERAGDLPHAQLPVVQPHGTAVHPSEGDIVERPTTEQSHGELARNFGSRQTLTTYGHRRANISAQEPRDSRPGGRWTHPPSTGGDLTNSRVRSTHPFHTKSPFSRFFGGRRQKSENITVSARGWRRPQAPTLRTSGCANARKCDYKSSSLYAQSN